MNSYPIELIAVYIVRFYMEKQVDITLTQLQKLTIYIRFVLQPKEIRGSFRNAYYLYFNKFKSDDVITLQKDHWIFRTNIDDLGEIKNILDGDNVLVEAQQHFEKVTRIVRFNEILQFVINTMFVSSASLSVKLIFFPALPSMIIIWIVLIYIFFNYPSADPEYVLID